MTQVYFKGVKQARWLDAPTWLQYGEAPADGLADLRTTNNALSVFRLPAEKADSLVRRVVAALAAKRERLDSYDYALVDTEVIGAIPVKVESTPGDTNDAEVNALHVEFVELSAQRTAAIAVALHRAAASGRLERISKAEVASLIKESIAASNLDRDGVSEEVMKSLQLD